MWEHWNFFRLLRLSFIWLIMTTMSVHIHIMFLGESFATEVADKWFLSCVDPHVSFQTNILSESFAKEVAEKLFLACVDPHVSFQNIRM